MRKGKILTTKFLIAFVIVTVGVTVMVIVMRGGIESTMQQALELGFE